jgi:anti-sigma28 factor (negative regulator of flagellin synthesis)
MTIHAIHGPNEVDGLKEVRQRVRHEETRRMEAHDSLDISAGARQASEVSQLARRPQGSEIRQEKVEAAKQRIQEGSYKMTEVILEVAVRIAGQI